MTIREELLAVLQHEVGSTVRVPRKLLLDALAACYGPAEEALATMRAECDADDEPWLAHPDHAYRRGHGSKLSFPAPSSEKSGGGVSPESKP